MSQLTHSEITALFLALGLLLASARILGELARAMNLPAVLGEITAGILWGPTVLGALFPQWSSFLFPLSGGGALAFDGLITLAITLFLLVAGMEIDLSTVWRQGKITLNVAIAGIIVPFGLGFVFAWYLPWQMGKEEGADLLIFALFIATALSISALPVIAKTLIDLNLYRTDMGMLVVATAVLNDLVGWIAFAVVLGMLGSAATALSIGQTIFLTLAFVLFMLTIGRWGVNATLPWVQAHSSWPGGVLGYALSLCLVAAAFTEWIGIHAIFGSFLAGVALGDSKHLNERTRTTINQFISFIFAPLFFASIGLKVNFIENFDLKLIVLVLVIATLGKVVGCGLAARFSGLGKRESWAVGFGLNARGAMEIILGLLALQNGIIGERLFVALVIMALVTSLMSGPMLQWLLRLKKPRRFVQYLHAHGFIPHLTSTDRWAAIHELAKQAATMLDIHPEVITRAAYAREKLMPTGIGQGVAIPHARLKGLERPLVLVGLSRTGIDFDAPDATPAKVIFLILAPHDDDGVQLEILADIAATFKVDEIKKKVGNVDNYVEFLALVRSAHGY
jgi:Kef-type K+ transport system membrane component KefB/mannitol/fructose-specific phosphotransferase system IIA component (Ntr-type)